MIFKLIICCFVLFFYMIFNSKGIYNVSKIKTKQNSLFRCDVLCSLGALHAVCQRGASGWFWTAGGVGSRGSGLSGGGCSGAAGLGSIYWNPATLTQFDGLQLGVNSTLIVPYSQMKNQPPTSAGYNAYSNFLGGSSSSGNIGIIGNVPSGQMTYRLSPDLWLGLSLSVPYGQSTKADASYVGRTYGSTTKVASVEVEPMLAYRLSDTVSLGAGIRYLNF